MGWQRRWGTKKPIQGAAPKRRASGHAKRRAALSLWRVRVVAVAGPGLPEPAAQQVEGLLRGPLSYPVAVAAEDFFHGLGFLGVGEGDVDQAYGLFFSGAGGAGDAGYAEAQSGAGAETDAGGEGLGDFGGDGDVLGAELGRDVGEGGLEGVGVDDGAAKGIRCSTHKIACMLPAARKHLANVLDRLDLL